MSEGEMNALTDAEIEVCRLLILGHTNGEIARELGLNAERIESIRNNLMAKLDLKGRAALVRYAKAYGLFKKS